MVKIGFERKIFSKPGPCGQCLCRCYDGHDFKLWEELLELLSYSAVLQK